MADSISYRLTSSGNPKLVDYIVNGVPKRLLFADSEADAELWAEYQAFLGKGGVPASAPADKTYAPPSIEQRLAAIGLDVDSLKTVLGLS